MSSSDEHGSGCFPCRFGKRKKRQEKLAEKSVVTPVGDVEPEQNKKASPTAADYALEATKKTIEILKGVATLAPVPLVKEVLELGLNIIKTCEAINDVQSKVAGLKNRIASFLLVVAKVTKDSKDEKSASRLSDDLSTDLQELKDCLALITTRLDSIKDQNAFLTGLLSQPNLQVIDDCELQFQHGISRFQTLQTLYAAQDLATIQQQLIKLYGITEEMAVDVKDTRQKVYEIESSVNDLKAMLTKNVLEQASILARMPRSPEVFFGRDVIVQRIAEQLSSGDIRRSRICIVGPGGMGKTSAALAIMEHELIQQSFTRQRRFWVPCISANSPTNFLALLSKHVGAERKTDDPLEDIISTLQETTEPCIILLDNFETPWHPVEGSQSTIRLVLEALDALPHVAILTTMRSEFSPLERWNCERLSQIHPEDSRKIYTAIDASAGNYPELDDLLDAVGHLPYAITLMASRGKRSLSNPQQLLQEWKEIGSPMLSKPEEGIDHSISLSIDSDFVSRSPGAIRLLQILSMLPAGIYHEDLSVWAAGWRSEAVDTLRDAALVLAREVVMGKTTKMHLFVLPVVQSHMKHRHRIPQEVQHQVFTACYQFLAKRSVTAEGPNDPHFQQYAIAITAQETNIQALLTRMIRDSFADSNPSPPPYINTPILTTPKEQLDALLAFAWHQHWTKPRPEIAEHVVALARKHGETRHEAAALFCLGSIFWTINKYQAAREAFSKAQTMFADLGNELMALRSELMDIDLDTAFGDFNIATERMGQARSSWGDRLVGNSNYNAWFLFHSGQINWYQVMNVDALADLKEAQSLFTELNPPCLLQAALANYYIARAYASLGDSIAALDAINAAITGFRSLYGENLTSQEWTSSHFIKGRILKGADLWNSDLDATFRTALQFYQELGLSRQIAQCLVEFAEIYVRNQDWPAARLAYEEAIKKCVGLDDFTSTSMVEEAQQNLRYIDHVAADHPAGEPPEFRTPLRA